MAKIARVLIHSCTDLGPFLSDHAVHIRR
jgi:hypothetical protein